MWWQSGVRAVHTCRIKIKLYNKNVLITRIRFLFSFFRSLEVSVGLTNKPRSMYLHTQATVIIHSPRSTCSIQLNDMSAFSLFSGARVRLVRVCLCIFRSLVNDNNNNKWLVAYGGTGCKREGDEQPPLPATTATRTFNLRYLINRSDLSLGEIRRH